MFIETGLEENSGTNDNTKILVATGNVHKT